MEQSDACGTRGALKGRRSRRQHQDFPPIRVGVETFTGGGGSGRVRDFSNVESDDDDGRITEGGNAGWSAACSVGQPAKCKGCIISGADDGGIIERGEVGRSVGRPSGEMK